MKNHRSIYSGSDTPAKIVQHPATQTVWTRRAGKDKIALPVKEGMRLVRVNDILYCGADSNYCLLQFKSGEQFLISKTLKWIEERLPNSAFLRVHARYLVSLDAIELLSTDYLILTGNLEIPIARSRRKELSSLSSRF